MEKELLYELILVDEDDGVFATSFVDSPAIERDFFYFGKEINFQAVSEEKMLVAGPLLIPNKKILRLDGLGNSYYVYFTPETIEKISRRFMKNKYNDAVTIEHDKKVSGINLTESWLIEMSSKDKSNIYGYTLPKGTWFGVYDVSGNPKVWQDVKNGVFKGFSIEGLFEHHVSDLKLSMDKSIDELTEDEAELFLSEIKALIKKDKRYKSKQRIEMESYTDYPEAVSNNAQKGIDYNLLNGNKCATPVGKIRAQQLAQRKPISLETIQRMYSYLSRAETYYTGADKNDCGYISFMLWGGLAGKRWAESKLRELGVLREGKNVAEELKAVELKEGVPHYTADGKLYEGPTHKDSEGKLMTGTFHDEYSEYLYHREELEAQPSISSTYPGEVAKKKKKDVSK
jgi:hypothetical protein